MSRTSAVNEADAPDAKLTAIEPIAPPEHLIEETANMRGDFYSKCVWVLSVLLALVAFIGSAVFFAGYAENDQNITHLISAFILSFGAGSLAYVPLGIIAFYARKSIRTPLPRARVFIVLLLLMPWLFLSYYLFQLGGQLRKGAIVTILSSLFIGAWALRFLKAR